MRTNDCNALRAAPQLTPEMVMAVLSEQDHCEADDESNVKKRAIDDIEVMRVVAVQRGRRLLDSHAPKDVIVFFKREATRLRGAMTASDLISAIQLRAITEAMESGDLAVLETSGNAHDAVLQVIDVTPLEVNGVRRERIVALLTYWLTWAEVEAAGRPLSEAGEARHAVRVAVRDFVQTMQGDRNRLRSFVEALCDFADGRTASEVAEPSGR